MKISLTTLMLLGILAFAQGQQTSDQQSAAYRASVAQEALKKDTAAVQAQLAEVAEAMRQLMPNDVAAVDRALKQMQNLSQGEMVAAVQALRDASRAGDRGAQLSNIAGAMKDQTKISSTLKQLAVDLDARQSLDGIATELSALLRRQVGAQMEVARLGKVQALPNDLRNDHHRQYEAVNDDQKLITQDVTALISRIDELAKNLPDDSRQRMVRAVAVARDRKLAEAEQSAASLTTSGPLPQAAETQNECAKTLVMMEQAVASQSPVERLAALSSELKKVTDQERELNANDPGARQSRAH